MAQIDVAYYTWRDQRYEDRVSLLRAIGEVRGHGFQERFTSEELRLRWKNHAVEIFKIAVIEMPDGKHRIQVGDGPWLKGVALDG